MIYNRGRITPAQSIHMCAKLRSNTDAVLQLRNYSNNNYLLSCIALSCVCALSAKQAALGSTQWFNSANLFIKCKHALKNI